MNSVNTLFLYIKAVYIQLNKRKKGTDYVFILFFIINQKKKNNNKKRTLINIYMYVHVHCDIAILCTLQRTAILLKHVSIIKKKLLYTTAVQTRFITTIKMKDNY